MLIIRAKFPQKVGQAVTCFAKGCTLSASSTHLCAGRYIQKGVKMTYLYLSIAIIAEIISTSALKSSEEFTKLYPSIIVVVGFGVSFYFLTLVLRTIPLGITYAIWSGVGIVLVAIIGVVFHKQILDMPAILGMGLIIAGVTVINVFSNNVAH